MEMIRTIHPIGQGAFYSEQFKEKDKKIANIVYDCGCGLDEKISDEGINVIHTAFNKTDVIDVLFISHFDQDHVNGIEALKNRVAQIKHVVMPLLSDEEKQIYILIYNIFTKKDVSHLINLITDPSSYFSAETKVIYINPISDNKEARNDLRFLEDVQRESTLESFQALSLRSIGHWFYIPIYYKEDERKVLFKQKLKSLGIEIDNFNLNNYPIDEMRNVYHQITGETNENSLLLCSFTKENKCNSLIIYNNQPQNCPCHLHSGCLYTGDSTLYKGLIESLQVKLGANMKYIGIIQVPHHGSKSSCKNRILEISKQSMYYFLSYGEGNTYGHPNNDVIKELIYGGKQIFCVNQFKTTSLIQYSII